MTGNVAEKRIRHEDIASAKESPCDVSGRKTPTGAFEKGRRKEGVYLPKGFVIGKSQIW